MMFKNLIFDFFVFYLTYFLILALRIVKILMKSWFIITLVSLICASSYAQEAII
jgi:hypothetical protein